MNTTKGIAIGITCIVGWLMCLSLTLDFFETYALGIFILLPIVMGFVCTSLAKRYAGFTRKQLRNTAYLALAIFSLGLLAFAIEGVFCIIMAFPLGMLFTWIGFAIAMRINTDDSRITNISILLLIISIPIVMAFEDANGGKGTLRSVTTSIVIKASPDKIWNNIIAFPKLKEPNEFIFRTGIAYPTDATINGEGVGAIRHCNFSTGSFIEPINIWNKPNLLRFTVEDQPAPMKELSPYNIHPNHLHDYWVSKQGQFKLTKQADGSTLVEGTTWYINKIKPDIYWTLWSDFIVHKIHNRVLQHIKEISEKS